MNIADCDNTNMDYSMIDTIEPEEIQEEILGSETEVYRMTSSIS